MKENAMIKVGAMIEVAKKELDNDPFWKIGVEDAIKLVDSQLREIETLEYIYGLIQSDDEEN
jgi:hypothetical protein